MTKRDRVRWKVSDRPFECPKCGCPGPNSIVYYVRDPIRKGPRVRVRKCRHCGWVWQTEEKNV
jgi:transcription elongation factor Elf1